MSSVSERFDAFLSSIFSAVGPEGLVECFSFLSDAFMITKDGCVIAANDAFIELIQYSRSELYGMSALDLITEGEKEDMARRFAEGNTDHYQLKLLPKDKNVLDVHVYPKSIYLHGQVYRLTEFIKASPEERIYIRLKESEEKFHSVFEQAAVGIARMSPTGSWLEVNQKLCDILGYSKRELYTLTFQDITYPDDLEADLALVDEMLQKKRQNYQIEKRYFHRNGSVIWGNLTVSLVSASDGTPKYFVSVIEDICLRKEMEQQLRVTASHDPLTGLFNRSKLNTALDNELTRAIRYSRPLSLLMIDIDFFKRVNDDHGHLAGDKVLVELSKILDIATRSTDIVSRFGGEEFLLVLPELDHEQALQLADRIRRTVEAHAISYQQKTINITVSIGVATYPEHGSSIDELVSAADGAMYKAKKAGRNRIASAVPETSR